MTILRTSFAALVSLMLCSLAMAAEPVAPPVKFSIESQPLEDALNEFAKQTGYQVLFQSEVALSQTAPRVDGELTPESALKALLANSGLRFRFVNPRTVAIGAGDESVAVGKTGELKLAQAQEGAAVGGTAAAAQGSPATGSAAESAESLDVLEEVLVTAQKKVERLQDVPVPVTALDAQSLTTTNQLRLEDYYSKVPGLNLSLVGNADAAPSVSIRGLTMGGQTNPTVSVVVDDIPYGSTVISGSDFSVADIDPGDLARVEVLRGPQGTLYGAASIGGLLKFATIEPSTEATTGRLQAGTSSVKSGDDLGYNLRGAVNMPLGDTFAIRASGFTVRDPGYIDNIQTGENDVNERESNGGRLAALWKPSETVSLNLSALIQDIERKGSADVTFLPGVGDLEQQSISNTGDYSRSTQAFGATLRAELGEVDFTSATGYSIDETESVQDVSATFLGSVLIPNFVPGSTGAVDFLSRKVDKISQEVRFVVPFGQKYEWLVGAFYTREKIESAADFWGVDAATAARVGRFIAVRQPDTQFEEYAAFTDLTVHFTDRFDIQFGGRWSRNKQEFSIARSGPFAVVFGPNLPPVDSEESPFTYLMTPRFRVSPDLMLYARFASGYRPGAPNVNCGLPNTPCHSDADTTQNYELGLKGNLAGRLLSYDASLFHIDWKDVQLEVVPPGGFAFTGNGGNAESQGIELAIESRPVTGLILSAWAVWNEAELTEIPANSTIVAQPGDRLPYGSRWSANFSLEQEFPLSSMATGFVGGSVSYIGDRKGVLLTAPGPRQDFPSYTQADLRAGVRFNTWTVNAFVNNVTDKRALLGGGIGFFIEPARNYTQPRTIGLSLTKTFDR